MSKVKLESICYVTKLSGFEYTKYIQPNKTNEGEVPLIIGRNVKDGKITSEIEGYISLELSEKLYRSALVEKCLVLPFVGTLKEIAIFDKKERYHLSSNVAKIEVLKEFKDSIELKYLYYYLRSPLGQLELFKHKKGSIQSNVNMKEIRDTNIILPSIEEQQKIASVLSALDDQIELNNKINQKLEDLAQTLYNYWFVQFEFPNEEGRPYKSSGGKMVWNEELKREIPEGWEVKHLGDELIFERGVEPGSKNYKTLKGDGDIKFYRVSDMENDSSTYINSSLAAGKVLDETDVVVSFDGTVGRIGFGLKGAYSTGMRKIYDENGNFNNALIYFIFKDEGIQNIIKKHATGSNILHAGGAIKYLSIPYDKKVFAFYKDKITPLFNEILLNKKQNQELAQLRDYLLPLLMNGQVGFSDEVK